MPNALVDVSLVDVSLVDVSLVDVSLAQILEDMSSLMPPPMSAHMSAHVSMRSSRHSEADEPIYSYRAQVRNQKQWLRLC